MKHPINLSLIKGKYKDYILLDDEPEPHSVIELQELTKKLRFVSKWMYVLKSTPSHEMFWTTGWILGEEQYSQYQQMIRDKKINSVLS